MRSVVQAQVDASELAFLADICFSADTSLSWLGSPPADHRVVIMRAGVRDDVAWVIMRTKARSLWIVPKSKLQDRHPSKPEALTNRFYFWRAHPQLLGQKRQ